MSLIREKRLKVAIQKNWGFPTARKGNHGTETEWWRRAPETQVRRNKIPVVLVNQESRLRKVCSLARVEEVSISENSKGNADHKGLYRLMGVGLLIVSKY